jgi:hypothetical protein
MFINSKTTTKGNTGFWKIFSPFFPLFSKRREKGSGNSPPTKEIRGICYANHHIHFIFAEARVTRLGEFSPHGRVFTLKVFLGNSRSPYQPTYFRGLLFPNINLYSCFEKLSKCIWQQFGRFYSQKNLVTQAERPVVVVVRTNFNS